MATFLKQWGTYYIKSGTSTTSYETDANGRIKVYLVSQNTSGNYSDIAIDHYIVLKKVSASYNSTVTGVTSSYRTNNGSYGGTYQSKTYTGTYYLGVSSGYEYFLGTTSHRVYHNADGTAQLYVNGSITATLWQGSDNTTVTGTKTSSFNVALPTIPRGTTINSFTLNKASGAAGLSRLTCGWSVSNTCDAVEYSLNGGGWTSSGTSGTSGSFNISGLSPNTQYSLKIRVKRTDSQLWTESGTIYQSTYDIARITVAPNNNVDVEPPFTINYTNPSGASLQTAIYKTDASTAIAGYRGCTSTGYEYLFTAGERTAFYNQIPSTKTLPLRIYLTTSDGLGNTYYNYVERTFEVFDANPTFTTWTYADTNATTVALTGSNQKIIKGYSNVKATITSANKMVANKGATATSYQLTIGTKPSATVAYSSSETVEMTVNAVDNNVFNCYAIDSRNNSTKVTKTLTTDYINYTPISITSATATRTDNIGTETTLAFSGNIFDGSFGSVSNSVKTATYKFKKTTDYSYTDGTSVITPTKTGGTFSFSGKIKGDAGSGGVDGFDATYSYNVQVIVTDELSTHTFNFILGSGTPNLAMHKDGIAINQAYDETLGGALQVNGSLKIPSTADVSLSSTDNPIQIGPTSGTNLVLDSNEVMARNNGATNSLALNADGGEVTVGVNAGANFKVKGIIESTRQNGLEGGEIRLNKPADGPMTGDVIISVYNNRLSFFQDASPYYGAYLPLTTGGNVGATQILTTADITTYDYTLTPITSSYAVGGWRTMATDYTTGVIPAGTYLMIFKFTVSSGQSAMGLTTTRVVIDGSEIYPLTRISIPTGGATMSGEIIAYVTFPTSTTHTLNGNTYPLYQAITGGTQTLSYSFIRLK